MTFRVSLRKELLEQWRSYRLVIAVVVLVAFGLLSPLAAKLTPELMKLLPNGGEIAKLIPPPTTMDAVAQYIKNTSQFALILAILMTMGAVAVEKDKGTAALMLVKPMPRCTFLVAKFIALALTFAFSILLAAVACYYYMLILAGALPLAAWLALNAFLLLEAWFYVALTLLCSTLTRSQAVAGGLGFGFVLLLVILESLPRLGDYLPGRLTSWGTELLAGGRMQAWPALWVTVGLIGVTLAAACLLFRGQEL